MKLIYCNSLAYILKNILNNIELVSENLIHFSNDFDYFWKRGKYTLELIKLGGYGSIGKLHFKNDSTIYFLENNVRKNVIIKLSRHPLSYKIESVSGIWLIDDQLSEIYFASFIYYLTELKVCPFLGNYLSIYLNTSIFIFIEQYKMDLTEFLPQLNEENTIIFIFQFIYSMYILKMYLGMIHFDTHLRNVMVVKSEKSCILFDKYKQNGIYLPNVDYCIKIIDFGLCTINLENSIDPFLKRDLKIGSYKFSNNISKVPNLYLNTVGSKFFTVEIMYFLLHLYQLIQRKSPDNSTLKKISNFANIFFNKTVNLNVPKLDEEKIILSEHNVGLDCEILSANDLIRRLKYYCSVEGSIFNYKNQTIYNPLKSGILDTPEIIHPKSKNSSIVQGNIGKSQKNINWFQDSFFIKNNKIGHQWVFETGKYKTSMSSITPFIGLCLTNKNEINDNNAFLSFSGNSIYFRYTKHENSFLCGKFLIFNKIIKTYENANITLVIAIKKNILFIIYSKTTYNVMLKFASSNKFDMLIDVSSYCNFIYEGKVYNNVDNIETFAVIEEI